MKLLEEGRARLERLRKEVAILQHGPYIGFQQTFPARSVATSIREGRVDEKGQPTVARKFRVCLRRRSDPMARRWTKDMNDALMAGNTRDMARMVVLVNDGTNQLKQWNSQSGAEGVTCVHGGGEVMADFGQTDFFF